LLLLLLVQIFFLAAAVAITLALLGQVLGMQQQFMGLL